MEPVEISHETFWLKVRTSADHVYWHCTSENRYQQIVREGYIEPNPSTVPNHERWKSQNPEYYSFVRKLKGVSLFDLKEFSEEDYSKKYPLSSWYEFLPICRKFGDTIWLEISLGKGDAYFSGKQLLQKWKTEGAYKNTIMPEIEAAYIGKIPFNKVKNVFKIINPHQKSTQNWANSLI